jgi:tetratricopeptide (TPR) repeat protein
LALDPESASALQLRGWLHYGRAEIQDAVVDLKAAARIEPNNADTLLLLINCYLISGKVPAARPLIERLLAIDPLTPLTRCLPAFADTMEGNFTAVLDPYRQMFEMDPGNPMARLFYVWALALHRRMDTIRAVLDTFPPELRDSVPAKLAAFLAEAVAGNAADAHAMVTTDIDAVATAADLFPRMIAQGYAQAAMPERALYWLAIAVDRGFINYPFLAHHDPSFEGLRRHPEFAALMARVRDRWERFEP